MFETRRHFFGLSHETHTNHRWTFRFFFSTFAWLWWWHQVQQQHLLETEHTKNTTDFKMRSSIADVWEIYPIFNHQIDRNLIFDLLLHGNFNFFFFSLSGGCISSTSIHCCFFLFTSQLLRFKYDGSMSIIVLISRSRPISFVYMTRIAI